jgi:glucarate dehydratase
VGEVPGGEKITQTLREAEPLVIGAGIGEYQRVLRGMTQRFGDRDVGGRGRQTFDRAWNGSPPTRLRSLTGR